MVYSRLLVVVTFILLIFYVDSLTSTNTKTSVKSVTLAVNGETKVCCGVKLHVNSIEDSRCPKQVQCVWAGQAKVEVLLSHKTTSSTANLIIGAQSHPNAQVTLGGKVYSVTLEDVIPYPGTGSTPSTAVIQVVCP